MIWVLFFIFIFGLLIGSFLNVLIYRLPRFLPITGRSICPKCKKKIIWYDNIPLLSFVFLGGKCRFCHSPIWISYPLVELGTGILFVMSYQWLVREIRGYQGIFELFFVFFILSVLVVIFVTDLRYQIIPDQIIFPAIVATFLFQILNYSNDQLLMTNYLLSALSSSLFFLILYFLTKRRGMGLGDVKLVFLMGLLLGFPKIILAFYLAFLTGAILGVILILIGKKRFGEHIPFGPFLTMAMVISLFWGNEILKWFTARLF